MDLPLLDWVLLAVLVVSLLLGAWRGLVYEMLTCAGWVAAFFFAQWWASDLATRLPLGNASAALRHAVAFVAIFIVGVFGSGLIAALLRRLVRAAGLRPVDRVLGAGFGLVRAAVLLLALAVLAALTPLHEAASWRESHGARWLEAALASLRPVLEQTFGAQLPA